MKSKVQANPRYFNIFSFRGGCGDFVRPSLGWGFDLCLGVVGNIELKVQVSIFFFLGNDVTLIAVNKSLDKME